MLLSLLNVVIFNKYSSIINILKLLPDWIKTLKELLLEKSNQLDDEKNIYFPNFSSL